MGKLYFWEVGDGSCFLLCRISKISQAIFLPLLSVWQAFMIFKGNFGFSVVSTQVHPPNPFFPLTMWPLWLQFAARKASRENWLDLVGTNEQRFHFPIFDPDRGSKAFQNLLFLNSRNKSFSWFGVYSFEPGFHYGYPCLCDSWTTWMSAMHSLLAALLAGSSNAMAKLECKYVPLNGSIREWQWLITSWSVLRDKKMLSSSKPSQGVYD